MSGIGAVSTTWEIGAARATTPSQTVGTKETKETQKAECQTCKERKYMDQSNEGDVSFQAPTHIAPGQAAAKVMSHEREHVQNAVAEGQKENKRLVSVRTRERIFKNRSMPGVWKDIYCRWNDSYKDADVPGKSI